MSANIIAAVIITVLSCVCVVLFVILLSGGVLQRMKKEVFRYIKVYNSYLEEPSENDNTKRIQPQMEKEEPAGLPEDPAIPFIPKNVPTRKQDFFADYLKIRKAFSYSPVKVLRQISENSGTGEAGGTTVAKEMTEKLSFETLYRISCLLPEQQLEVLDAIFTDEEKKVLEQYRETVSGEFSVTDFGLYLQGKSKESDDTVYLYTREPEDLGLQAKSEQLRICKDENLCEGFQIVQGNRLYDYGLRSSEMIL